jgi:alpha-pyrone synthase
LARTALDRLELTTDERRSISHVIVTSCTGLYAPGLDFEVVNHLGLNPSVERTMIGFMGCYAALNALKSAHHIVRSEPQARVLVLNLELCSLHFQETQALEQVLSFLVFADGCAASLVSAAPTGLAIDSFLAVNIPDTSHLITWRIGELGFDMQLSGEVPGRIGTALKDGGTQVTRGSDPESIDLWAVHPGGRSILDSVEKGLSLKPDALVSSRDVLARYGNMSSATVMFVLREIIAACSGRADRVRHVLRARAHRRNDALPCCLIDRTSPGARASSNAWTSPAHATTCEPACVTSPAPIAGRWPTARCWHGSMASRQHLRE